MCSATNGVQRGRVLRRTAASPDVVSFVDPNDIRKPSAAAAGPAVDKVGVLLLNLGGPETLDDVKPFLYNLFADPEIIRLPAAAQFLQPLLATIISTLRAPKSAEGYEAIGGGSPLRKITDDQAEALAQSLRAKGQPANVYVGMRYWHPYTEEALEHIKADGVTRLVILPLYPQFSISTSGSSLRLLESLFKTDRALKSLRHTVIPSWYQRRGYVSAMADLIVEVRGAAVGATRGGCGRVVWAGGGVQPRACGAAATRVWPAARRRGAPGPVSHCSSWGKSRGLFAVRGGHLWAAAQFC